MSTPRNIDARCKCSHRASEHDPRYPGEPCNDKLHPACGCIEFRLDPRAPITAEADEETREAG